MTASGVAESSAGARPLASAAFTVFREIPITCAICAIGICSARLSRRISAQSSPLSTCFLPDSARARLSGKLVKFQLPPTCRSDRQRLPDRWDGQGSSGTGDAGGQPQPEGSAGRLWRFQSSVAEVPLTRTGRFKPRQVVAVRCQLPGGLIARLP